MRFVRFDYGVLPAERGAPIPYLATYGMIHGWPSAGEWIPPNQGGWWEDETLTVRKRHKQLYKHDPENKVYGDCERATLACLLDYGSVEDVPHFSVDENGDLEPAGRFWDKVDAWLGERGYRRFKILYPGDIPFPDLMRSMGIMNPGVYWRLTGTSRTGCNHVVICYGDAIWHDTSLTDAGIVGPADDGYWWAEVLISTRFTEFRRPRGHEDLPPAPVGKGLEVGEPV